MYRFLDGEPPLDIKAFLGIAAQRVERAAIVNVAGDDDEADFLTIRE